MNLPAAVKPFWEEFQKGITFDATDRFYEVFHFDDNEKDANDLAALVLQGTKCATASLIWTYEEERKPVPKQGDLSVVTDWSGKPLCVIESIAVNVVPFSEVTESFAATEGEGDKSLQFWRKVHWSYFGRECQRLGREPSEDMLVVCEEFSVIYRS